jgi:hypothetical protein
LLIKKQDEGSVKLPFDQQLFKVKKLQAPEGAWRKKLI